MKRSTAAVLLPAVWILAGCVDEPPVPTSRPTQTQANSHDVSGKRVLMLVASQNFRDEEFQEPYSLLGGKGVRITVASSSADEAVGMLQQVRVKPDKLLTEVKAADYDAVLFVGGSGAQEYFENPTALALAREAAGQGKLVAAICVAPTILANAGVLEGKTATVFNDAKLRRNLTGKGARLGSEAVIVDGRVITADGPGAAGAFAKAVLKALGDG